MRPVLRERGATLVTMLFLMLALLMMSLSGTRAALAGARSARHERDRQVAHAAAEAALVDAERDIEGAAGAASPGKSLIPGGGTPRSVRAIPLDSDVPSALVRLLSALRAAASRPTPPGRKRSKGNQALPGARRVFSCPDGHPRQAVPRPLAAGLAP